ncbi:MAG: hypothetical protein JWN49_684 [Parcubacteria group bacterium]|nr:hypothetical protein [Parcubacteria group bacterium]
MVENSAATATARLALLLENQALFEEQYPNLIMEFLSVFTYRKTTVGFPECVDPDRALDVTIEVLYKDFVGPQSILGVRALIRTGNGLVPKPTQTMAEEIQKYSESVSRVLTSLVSVRPFVIDDFFRNLAMNEVDTVTYIAALHLEYISRKEFLPY